MQQKRPVHVQNIVKEAKSQGVPITIKNGDRSYSGPSTTDEGILLDLSLMNKAHFDIEAMLIDLEGGALWGQAYKQLTNDHHDGLVINGVRCPNVGVSGYNLGGGLRPFGRSLGMVLVRGLYRFGCCNRGTSCSHAHLICIHSFCENIGKMEAGWESYIVQWGNLRAFAHGVDRCISVEG